MISWFHETFTTFAHTVPLEIFAFVAAFFEEIIPPIPAFPVMVMAGSFAKVQDYHLIAIFVLALFSSLGKTFGALTVYYVVDKIEDYFMLKFGNLFNLEPGKLESLGRRLGKGWSDYFVLIALRAIPIVPSTLISVGSGLLKIPLKLFVVTTFIGTIMRDCLYLYIGYVGTRAFHKYYIGSESHFFIKSLAITLLIAFIIYYILKRRALKQN